MQLSLKDCQKLIEKACSKKLAKPNIESYKECANMFNSRPDM